VVWVTAHGELDHESGAKLAISADAVDLELIPGPGWATSGVRGVQQPLQDLINFWLRIDERKWLLPDAQRAASSSCLRSVASLVSVSKSIIETIW
jgi:hypothetical protein